MKTVVTPSTTVFSPAARTAAPPTVNPVTTAPTFMGAISTPAPHAVTGTISPWSAIIRYNPLFLFPVMVCGVQALEMGLSAGPRAGWPFWVWVMVANFWGYALIRGNLTIPRSLPRSVRLPLSFFRAVAVAYTLLSLLTHTSPLARYSEYRLQEATMRGDVSTIEVYAALGGRLNHRFSETGETPLTTAARYQQLPAVEALVRLGANINRRNENGLTPFDVAASSRDLTQEQVENRQAIEVYLANHGAKGSGGFVRKEALPPF